MLNHACPLVIVGIYHPPSANHNALNRLSELFISQICSEAVILEDSNIDWMSHAADDLKDLCTELNLTQMITEPT